MWPMNLSKTSITISVYVMSKPSILFPSIVRLWLFVTWIADLSEFELSISLFLITLLGPSIHITDAWRFAELFVKLLPLTVTLLATVCTAPPKSAELFVNPQPSITPSSLSKYKAPPLEPSFPVKLHPSMRAPLPSQYTAPPSTPVLFSKWLFSRVPSGPFQFNAPPRLPAVLLIKMHPSTVQLRAVFAMDSAPLFNLALLFMNVRFLSLTFIANTFIPPT